MSAIKPVDSMVPVWPSPSPLSGVPENFITVLAPPKQLPKALSVSVTAPKYFLPANTTVSEYLTAFHTPSPKEDLIGPSRKRVTPPIDIPEPGRRLSSARGDDALYDLSPPTPVSSTGFCLSPKSAGRAFKSLGSPDFHQEMMDEKIRDLEREKEALKSQVDGLTEMNHYMSLKLRETQEEVEKGKEITILFRSIIQNVLNEIQSHGGSREDVVKMVHHYIKLYNLPEELTAAEKQKLYHVRIEV